MIRPCANRVVCPSESPLASYNTEATEVRPYLGTVYHERSPLLGSEWSADYCVRTCDSSLSQEDADLCALRQARLCLDPDALYYSTQQSIDLECSDGTTFTYVLAAASFTGLSQAEADAQASTYAQQHALEDRFCCGEIDCCGCVGALYESEAILSGNTRDVTVALDAGALPPGIALPTGTISNMRILVSGTPTTAGSYAFTLLITDEDGNHLRKTFTLHFAQVSTASLSGGTEGVAYADTLTATGGSGNYTWSISAGSLPAGLSLDAGTGQITGTPTLAGTISFTVQVTDADLSVSCSKALSIAIAAVAPPEPPEPPAPPTPTAWWPLDEGSGDRADTVGSLIMTPTGSSVLSGAGKISNALRMYNAVTQLAHKLELSQSAALATNGTGFSLAFWINADPGSDPRIFFELYDNIGNILGYFYREYSAGTLYVGVYDYVDYVELALPAHTGRDSNWHFCIIRYNYTTGKLSYQEDNGAINEAPGSFILLTAPRGTLRVQGANANQYFIDELGLYLTTTLSADQGASLWNSGAGRTYPF